MPNLVQFAMSQIMHFEPPNVRVGVEKIRLEEFAIGRCHQCDERLGLWSACVDGWQLGSEDEMKSEGTLVVYPERSIQNVVHCRSEGRPAPRMLSTPGCHPSSGTQGTAFGFLSQPDHARTLVSPFAGAKCTPLQRRASTSWGTPPHQLRALNQRWRCACRSRYTCAPAYGYKRGKRSRVCCLRDSWLHHRLHHRYGSLNSCTCTLTVQSDPPRELRGSVVFFRLLDSLALSCRHYYWCGTPMNVCYQFPPRYER